MLSRRRSRNFFSQVDEPFRRSTRLSGFEQEILMRTWNIALACAVLSAALMVTIVHDRANTSAGVVSIGHAAPADTTYIAHAEQRPDNGNPDTEHGWGPVRTTDW
jgi:hypothetical protein